MRKSSSEYGRPSLSGAPMRVRQDNIPSHGSRPSSMERASSSSSKLPVSKRMSSSSSSQQFRSRQSSMGKGTVQDHRKSVGQMSFIPKTGRPSSGIGVRGRTDLPKDTRPISDKRYQNQCITSLLEFLTSHRYPHPISHKLLGSPSNKDFSNIFEFIMGHFSQDYKLTGSKLQEVVPGDLKLLGYPFNLPKTYLCSVGSPHTWPHLLAALTWMIELLQTKNSIGVDIDRLVFLDSAGDDFDVMSDEKISFDYKERIFNAFMTGANSYEEEDQALEKMFMEKYYGGDININAIIEENRRLEIMLDDTEKMEDRISSLKEHYKNQSQNDVQFRDYLDQIQRHKMALLTELEKCNEELLIAKSDLEKEECRLNSMKIAYESQELKPEDVQRLKAEHDLLRAQMEQLEKQDADMDAEIWQLNMEQAKHNEKLQEDVAKYNRLAIALKIVPESAECADGKDFRLHMGVSSDLVMNFQHNIKPKLMLMKKNHNEQHRTNKKEEFRLVCNIEKMQELLNEKKDGLVQKEREIAQMESEIELRKQASTTEHKSLSEELRKIEQDATQLNTYLAQQKTEQDKFLEILSEMQNKSTLTKSEIQQEIKMIREMKMEAGVKVKEHAENVKKQLMEVLEQVETASAEATQKLALAQEASQRRRQRFGLH